MQKTKSFSDLGVDLYIKEDEKLPIYYFRKENSPLTVYYQFDCGSVKDLKPGMSHFLEHMIVSGTKKYHTKELLSDAFANQGGIRNAFTSQPTLAIALFMTDVEDIEFVKEMLDEFIYNSIFDEEIFEKEKTAILDEIRRSESNFDKIISRVIFSNLYEGTPLAHHVLGTTESVSSISRDDLINFYKNVLLQSKQSLVVSGDADPAIVGKMTERLQEKMSVPAFKEENKFLEAKSVNITSAINQKTSGVFVGYNTPAFDNPVATALGSFLSWKLFSQSGLLISRLRYELGLTYSVRPQGFTTKFNGFTGAFTSCSIDKLEQAKEEIIKIYEEKIFDHINTEEIQRFLKYIKRSRKRTFEKVVGWLDQYGYRLQQQGKNVTLIDDTDSILENTPVEELKALAKSFLIPENRSVILFEGIEQNDRK